MPKNSRENKWFKFYHDYLNHRKHCEMVKTEVKPSKPIYNWIRRQTESRYLHKNMSDKTIKILNQVNFTWDTVIINSLPS